MQCRQQQQDVVTAHARAAGKNTNKRRTRQVVDYEQAAGGEAVGDDPHCRRSDGTDRRIRHILHQDPP